jgi:hypothetical protein
MMLKQPPCACVHPDAQACFESRNPGLHPLEDHHFHRFERCDCWCHDEDEDGRTGWDAD